MYSHLVLSVNRQEKEEAIVITPQVAYNQHFTQNIKQMKINKPICEISRNSLFLHRCFCVDVIVAADVDAAVLCY